jgi:hypothetical protein
MASVKSRRRSRALRVTFERVVMVGSLLAGLGIVGSCATIGTGVERGVSAAGGLLVALVLVGTVFLFTTMSRDLRLLRERMAEGGDTATREQQAADTSASGTGGDA